MKLFIFLIYFTLNPDLNGQSVKPVLDAMVNMDQGYLDKSLSSDLVFISEEAEGGGLTQMKSFLSTHRIKSYKIIHEGVSKGKDEYMGIGGLITDKGKFRIYISFKAKDSNKYMVSEVRLEKDLL